MRNGPPRLRKREHLSPWDRRKVARRLDSAPCLRGFDPVCAWFPAHPRHFRDVPLSRIAWLLTVAVALVTALLLLISSYNGYALLAFAVGLSAAINLR